MVKKTIHRSKAVVLCTGRHTRTWKRSYLRNREKYSRGSFLVFYAGGELMHMEMMQFHPTGMLHPDNIERTLVTEAVSG